VLYIPKTDKAIKAAKDKDRDIKITRNNNIILNQTIKVVLLLKFLGKPNKLEEYLNKIQIYINYNKNRFKEEYIKILFTMFYLEKDVFKYISIYYRD
jgi:hypothetical protein